MRATPLYSPVHYTDHAGVRVVQECGPAQMCYTMNGAPPPPPPPPPPGPARPPATLHGGRAPKFSLTFRR
ncbi:hypothetical protein JYU34_009162 [Plutella xylostella]|uniref:Uncharacterized protein n=1 Tax=Plutella xylostella TaxID=51655 RepID=A0ABQ7QNA3_PLUXY|nr:hypothetical protein JYU34_009162 [Plutella xylostella]